MHFAISKTLAQRPTPDLPDGPDRLPAGADSATSSLGIQTYFESKSLARFCCDFLNLQRLAESAFSKLDRPIEAQTRHVSPSSNLVACFLILI